MFRFASVSLIAFSAVMAGCAARYIPEPRECGGALPSVLSKVNMTELMGKMANEFCPTGVGALNPLITDRDVVLVPDFLDLSSFKPGQAGVVLGEVTRGALSEVCRHRVRQVDLGKTIRLNEDGVVMLTRDSGRLSSSEFAAKWGYVGTFSTMPGKLLLTLRELDIESGATTRIISRELNFGCKLGDGEYKFSYSVN